MHCQLDPHVTVRCDVGERAFVVSLPLDGAPPRMVLTSSDGETLHVSIGEWQALIAAVDQARRLTARLSAPQPNAPNHGKPWTSEADAALTVCWRAGDRLSALAARFGRTPGGISSRLCHLGVVQSREEADLPAAQRLRPPG